MTSEFTHGPESGASPLEELKEMMRQLQQAVGASPDVAMASLESLGADTAAREPIYSMDPRLQRLVASRRLGVVAAATASTAENEVAVIARVSSIADWEGLSEVRVGTTIGDQDENGEYLVTGRIPITRIENVRQQKCVRSLKAAQPVQPVLHATTQETGARPVNLPAGNKTKGGAGVVVGVVDYGGDFVHENFRNANGTTRLLSIWHQGGSAIPSSPFGYGREFSKAQINAALRTSDPYGTLNYHFASGEHGTHVMDIAAGNGNGSDTAGVAPKADLVFVDVSHADINFSSHEVVGESFGDSTRLLEALKYIFDIAGTRPCAINVSLGTNGGPHDGSTLVEDGIDRLLKQAPNRAVVIAASNSFDDGIHAAGSVVENGHTDLSWKVAPGDFSHNELELWYAGADRIAVELIAPNGFSLGRVEPGETLPLANNGQVLVFVANRLDEPNNHDNMIGIFLESGLPPGSWTVRLHGVAIKDGSFHAWIERDNTNQSNFAPPHDNSHTIGSISCGHEAIVVGSYDAHKSSRPISYFSSAGPTRDGREKPEISAPGHAVRAANSRSIDGTTIMSGTSMASPAVAGITALVFAAASARGKDLEIAEIRQILFDSARRDPPAGTDWDSRFGVGRISATGAVQAVLPDGGVVPSGGSTQVSGKKKKSPKKKKTSKKKVSTQKKGKGEEKGEGIRSRKKKVKALTER